MRDVDARERELTGETQALHSHITKLEQVSRDASERKKAEEALRETTQTLEAVIQASPLPIFAVDRERIVKTWNPAAERIFGWAHRKSSDVNFPLSLKRKWMKPMPCSRVRWKAD